MNVELLLKVKEQILREPRRFDMSTWAFKKKGCGTTCCIAGWAVQLSGLDALAFEKKCFDDLESVEKLACERLGISGDDAAGLFYCHEWPYEFRERYVSSSKRSDDARIAAEYIDYFIAQHSEVSA